jgi:hypothetical protein
MPFIFNHSRTLNDPHGEATFGFVCWHRASVMEIDPLLHQRQRLSLKPGMVRLRDAPMHALTLRPEPIRDAPERPENCSTCSEIMPKQKGGLICISGRWADGIGVCCEQGCSEKKPRTPKNTPAPEAAARVPAQLTFWCRISLKILEVICKAKLSNHPLTPSFTAPKARM